MSQAGKRRKLDKRRIGIVGYGKLGQFLAQQVQTNPGLELAFVWNRTLEACSSLPPDVVISDLRKCAESNPSLIIEVAHPDITRQHGEFFLSIADYMVGSPTIFADADVEAKMRKAAKESNHGLYLPSGAFWGAEDVQKMADRGTLKGLKVTMKKHPSSFKVLGELVAKTEAAKSNPDATVLYDGPVRNLCPLAPNNVNTMAVASMAAHNLGFDKVQGCLVADNSLEAHIVEIDVTGPGEPSNEFSVKTVRHNPAKVGAVTGNATFASFLSSMLRARGLGNGVHFC
eukprot:m.113306 g.113306  ORF g.113306 m.113306 type:complete len:286 (+) comp22872_c0_seq2:103-960(+)